MPTGSTKKGLCQCLMSCEVMLCVCVCVSRLDEWDSNVDTRTHYSLLTSDRDGCGDLLVIMIVIIFFSNSIHFVLSVKVNAPRGTAASLLYELREMRLTRETSPGSARGEGRSEVG